LLVGAGLLMVSFKHLLDVAPGFQPENLIAAPLVLPESRYENRARAVLFYQSLLERVRGVPDVEAAGAVSALPFSGSDARANFQIEGRTAQSPTPVRAHPRLVTPGYLTTLGIPLVRGRLLTDRDAEGSPDVVIINLAAARRYWPNEDPIGKRISFAFGVARSLQIVGIVGDIKHASLDVDAEPEAYLSYLQSNFETMTRFMTIVVRTRSDAAKIAPLLRAAVKELDADQAIGTVAQMQTLIDRTIAARRLNLWLVSGFAFVALVLTAAGLYGVMAYLVVQRTYEIGVRMALGASPRSVVALVLRQGAVVTLVGILVGLASAAAVSRLIAGLLFGVSATDPVVYVAVTAVLGAVSLLSITVPLLRATRIDPLTALRQS
jgi:putative ABC transport system permease protein